MIVDKIIELLNESGLGKFSVANVIGGDMIVIQGPFASDRQAYEEGKLGAKLVAENMK